MPRVSGIVREEAFEKLRTGFTVEQIADEYGVSTQTANKWAAEATGEPGVVSPPQVKMQGKGRKAKHGVKPISDDTAGMIAAGLFSIAALVDQEPCWYLTDVERKALAEPLAESLKLLPGPVADAVNTYTAPGVLITAAATIVNHKLQYRAAKRAGKLRAVPSPAAPATPPQQQKPTAETWDQGAASEPATKPIVDPAISDALAAARGSLADEEESEEKLFASGLA